jgi:hypothetical protein
VSDDTRPAELLAPWIEKAREIATSADSLNEAIGGLILEVMQSEKGDIIATLALLQLADEGREWLATHDKEAAR